MIWMLVHLFIPKKLFLCHCQMLNITLMDFDDSSSDFSLPPVDLNTVCFPSQGPLYCPQVVNFSRSVEKCWCHSYQGFCKFDRCFYLTIFLVLESNLIFQRSCLFKSNCWNEIKEMSILKSIFGNQACLVKDPTHAIQCNPLIVLYFENRNWPGVRLKWLFHGSLCQF